jgi:protein TonB
MKCHSAPDFYEMLHVSGPGELRKSAVDVFERSPNWIPGIDNGRAVKEYKKQPIVFRLTEE